jgi:hypothetical protein
VEGETVGVLERGAVELDLNATATARYCTYFDGFFQETVTNGRETLAIQGRMKQ